MSMSQEQAAAVIAYKAAEAKKLLDECQEIGNVHDIPVSYEVVGTGPTMENLDDKSDWVSSSASC
jgi:hypothetical protein